ncbi:MAG: hypothetical protein ABSB76_18985 [Streptosporangiaceae bacterium]|jgi:hypothetical protein
MKKSQFCALSAAAVIGLALTSTAASAAVRGTVPSSTPDPTTVTFTVGSGLLTMTAPDSVVLLPPAGTDTALPGTTVSAVMGDTFVTDDRALLDATWTATALSSTFVTGTHTTDETIPAADASYDPGTITETAGIFLAAPIGTAVTLSATAQTVVTANADGDNVATWDALLSVAIPTTAVLGGYTGTLTQSVS